MSAFDLQLGTCGCCDPPALATPIRIWNRPSLDEVAYRVGTYSSFRQAMIQLVPRMTAELAITEGLAEPPLSHWTSRQSDDYGIAFFELWATIGDILTFYTERYAHEAWLRTADHRDSVRRLAGLLGYRLNPGAAAATHLAYLLDDNVALTLPAGLRVQSVPKEGEQPQKFETVEAIDASSGLNRVSVFGEPRFVSVLLQGNDHETLAPGSIVPLPDDKVILFSDGANLQEERTIDRVDEFDGRRILHWSAPLHFGHTEAWLPKRAFRLFGHNAPSSHLVATPQGSPAFSVAWTQANTEFSVTTNAVDIDGTIEGIEVGTEVLVIDAGGAARRRTVNGVSSVLGVVEDVNGSEVLSGAATRLTLDGGTMTLDLSTTRVHELDHQLTFLGWEVPRDPIPGGTTEIYLPYPEVGSLAKDRLIILDDGNDPFLAEVAEDAVPFGMGGEDEFLRVVLDQPTARSLDSATAHLLGNISPATHGETIADEIVGDGDTSQTLQEFTLAKAPVTHVSDPTAPGGAASTLQLFVDRARWEERSGLFGAGPTERIFTSSIDDDAKTTVEFGDGITGARLPSGRGNVVATYRQGLGRPGNLDPGQLATALDKPTGVNGVASPLPAAGGVDPETLDGARDNAPNTVRTFDRAVSLRDFADLAREYVGVEKTFATWVWDGEEQVVHVTVGGEDGAELDSDQLGDIRAYLDWRRDPNRSLRIGAYRSVPFVVEVAVEAQADRFNEDVESAVTRAVDEYFGYDNRGFGESVHLSDIYAVVHSVPEVVSAVVTRLRYKRFIDRLTHGLSLGLVAVHLPIFGARHLTSGSIAPAELASLENIADVTVSVTGGLVS